MATTETAITVGRLALLVAETVVSAQNGLDPTKAVVATAERLGVDLKAPLGGGGTSAAPRTQSEPQPLEPEKWEQAGAADWRWVRYEQTQYDGFCESALGGCGANYPPGTDVYSTAEKVELFGRSRKRRLHATCFHALRGTEAEATTEEPPF